MTLTNGNRLRVLAALCAVLVATAIVGCGGASDDRTGSGGEAGKESFASGASSASMEAMPANAPMVAGAAQQKAQSNETGAGSGAVKAKDSAARPSGVKRKIIYNADVALAVENLAPAQQKLMALVQKFNGYVAEENVGGSSGAPRTGRWKVRVPADGYNGFMGAVSKVGEVQTISSRSEDVSAEFYDVEARLRNKRVEENRLIEHLKNTTAKLADILLVEREISRVRGEIEQMQGRLRVLADLTALTTVTVTLNEIKDYVPPAPPTFATQIARSFSSSLGALTDFCKSVVLSLVALAPWLVILLPLGFVLWRLYRRR